MKLPESLTRESSHTSVGLNTFGLVGVSMVWGHMLGLLSLWFLPLTIASVMIGYGTEIQSRKGRTLSL